MCHPGQAVTTRYIEKHIHKTSSNDRCRLCNKFPETIHHIIAGCPSLSQTVYTDRHNNVAKYIYIKLGIHAGLLQTNDKWYKFKPECVLENTNYKILWDFQIMTDHAIYHNKPDIVFIDKIKKVAQIIDIAIPMDINVVAKRFEKIRNYANLAIELKECWNLNYVSIIPVIIGCTGTIHCELSTDLKKLDIIIGKKDLIEMQQIAILGTTYIWRHFSAISKGPCPNYRSQSFLTNRFFLIIRFCRNRFF